MEMKDYRSRVFRTRVSALFIVIFGALLYLGWLVDGLKGFVIFGIGIVLCPIAFRSMYYVLTDKEIHFFYLWGLFGKPFGRINISAITSVERSYNPLPASAASLKRLHIHFKKGYTWHLYLPFSMFPMISPVREQDFLKMLKEINPNIQIKLNDKKGWWRFWDWDFNY
jgi:hypothetical protein